MPERGLGDHIIWSLSLASRLSLPLEYRSHDGEDRKMPHFIREFFDIWVAWWTATKPISEDALWGHPVFFWGRCGKVMELIAAFFLLYEILGKEKSSEIAAKFTQVYSIATFFKSDPVGKINEKYRQIDIAWKGGILKFVKKMWILLLAWFLAFAGAWLYTQSSGPSFILVLLFASYLGLVILSLAILLLFFILAEIARLYSWLAAIEPRLRIVNLTVLAVGIMFDLLAT
jgi:hypothetical protein